MSLFSPDLKVICQGILTPAGLQHIEQSIACGTKIVGGVASGKGGEKIMGIPLFDTVEQAVKKLHPDITVIYGSPLQAKSEIESAINAKIKWIVCPIERIPIHDILQIQPKLKKSKSQLIGPASPGFVIPEKMKVGTMPPHLFKKGDIGIISRSSSIIYEAISQLSAYNLGVSAVLTLGAYPILGTSFKNAFDWFMQDKNTKEILIIGEIGTFGEQQLAHYYKNFKNRKTLYAYIAGSFAPTNQFIGNIGAIIQSEEETAGYKKKSLFDSGAILINSPADIALTIAKNRGLK